QLADQYDAAVLSLPGFEGRLGIPMYVLQPSIDPLSEKNRALSTRELTDILTSLRVARDKPLLVQVGPFTPRYDPMGVGNAGGLAQQIIPNVTGYTGYTVEGAAFRIRHLLNNPELIPRMGAAGREHVRRSFLITRHLTDFLALMIHLAR